MHPSKADQVIDGVLKVAQGFLDIVKDASGPVPGLGGAASVLSSLIGMIAKTRENEEVRKELADNIKTLASNIVTIRDMAYNASSAYGTTRLSSLELDDRISALKRKLDDILCEASELKKYAQLRKFYCSKSVANTLSKLKQGIDEANKTFFMQGQITIEHLLNGVIEQLTEKVLDYLPHVNARYSSTLIPTTSGVLEGTRADILEDMMAWTRGYGPTGNDPLIYVLTGGAGTGKSTIAHEVAERLDKSGSLGASFFFVRDVEKLSSTRHIIGSIAYQLAHSQAQIRPHIIAAANTFKKQGKQNEQLKFELESLLIKPLREVPALHHRVIIVIDALDECKESAQDDIVQFLYLLIQQLPSVPFPLRVLVTTRPEMNIQEALDSVDFQKISKPFRMQDIPRNSADADIKLFLDKKLCSVECREEIFSAHPTLIDDLTRCANGLFIFAATVVMFLEQHTPFRPNKTLEALLSDNHVGVAHSLGPLNRLYLTVLQNPFSDDELNSEDIKNNIQAVLGVLALVQDHVSANVMKDLVGVLVEDTDYILSRLGSVILIAKKANKKIDENREIQMLHSSFRQFLIDETRCKNITFYVNPVVHHTRLTTGCLEIMTRGGVLVKNICQLDDPLIHKSDIADLHERVKEFIPPHLQYACVHWATHLTESKATPQLLGLVEKFMTTNLMVWIETLSFLGRLEDAVPALLAAHRWWQNSVKKDETNIPELVKNAHQLVLEFFLPITLCPWQIYDTALTFAPSCKLVEVYANENSPNSHRSSPRLLLPRNPSWSPCLRVIETSATAVEYSPDGCWIALGSENGSVRIWDSGVGTLKRTLVGHKGGVWCLAWRPDGKWIVSGSLDGSFCVWSVVSGARAHRQTVSGRVMKVLWDTAGTRVVSVDDEGGLQVWKVTIGKEVMMVKSIPALKWVEAISKDLTRVVDVSDDGLRLWDVEGKKIIQEMRSAYTHLVLSAAFLHNETEIVSGGGNETVVWDAATGKIIRSLTANSANIAVSPKGDLIAVFDYDYDVIQFWDPQTWQSRGELTTIGNLRSLSFSPDGERLTSSSLTTIQLWDLSHPISEPPTKQVEPQNVIFSPDHSHVAAVMKDKIAVWSATSQLRVPTCVIYGNFGPRVTFSPDATKLAVTNKDTTVCIWNVTSTPPILLSTLPNTMGRGEKAVWSTDGRLISITVFNSVGVFNAETSERVDQYGHDSFPVPRNNGTTHLQLYEDGWVRTHSGKKMCWIPTSRRPNAWRKVVWQDHNHFAIFSDSAQLTILAFDNLTITEDVEAIK